MVEENIILETFLRLTSRTYPYGTESGLVDDMVEIGLFPSDLQKDKWGNYFYKIGESRTVFASHLDTVSKDQTDVVHTFDGNFIKTDGNTILGADDKAGVTILLHLIRNNIPGLYYFFVGEEVGCIGSGMASTRVDDFKGKYDRIISFDRRDTGSVITYQSSTRCCSDEFAEAICDGLNISGLDYNKDDTGVYTDSAEFTSIIPECTNISVGYYNEHTKTESQNIVHLEKLANACLFVNWEELPTQRDPATKEYKKYESWRYGTDYYDEFEERWLNDRSVANDNHYVGSSKTGWAPKDDGKYEDVDAEEYPEYTNYKKNRIQKDLDRERDLFYDNGSKTVKLNKKPENRDKVFSSGGFDNSNYYDCLIDKILDSELSREELDVVKDQYLDMTNENDKLFYSYLLGNVID